MCCWLVVVDARHVNTKKLRHRSHHHAFLLEDDIEVSPHFYAWSKWATLTYQYGAPSDFMENMYGVSLYTPRYDYHVNFFFILLVAPVA